MADTIRVTVAAGCHITIAPHPSGIPGLPPLVLNGGNTLDVTPERLAELLQARLILDPATGRPVPPPPPPPDRGPQITVDGGRSWHGDARYMPAPPSAPVEVNAREPIRAGSWNPGFSDMVKVWDQQNPDPIVDVHGRPWPGF